MLLLGIDFETGGAFDAPFEDNFITEVGAVAWDTDLDMPVKMYSKLIRSAVEIPEEVSEYTGVTKRMLDLYGENEPNVIIGLMDLIMEADALVAHNGNGFDRPLFEQTIKRLNDKGLLPKYETFKKRYDKIPWVDTQQDIDYPNNCKARSLTYLAGFHLILNCFPHRALTDVLTMLTVMMKYDLNTTLGNALEPKVIVRAAVSYQQRDLAKKERFSWENAGDKKYEKTWVKLMRKSEFERLQPTWPFVSMIIEGV